MERNLWLVYVILAGLAWGTYVPIIFYGGSELGGNRLSRMVAILCVGGATSSSACSCRSSFSSPRTGKSGRRSSANGLIFSSLAGVAGAVGALCVIFASGAAMATGKAIHEQNPSFNPATFRLFIGPLIFGLAPIINTLISAVWHPTRSRTIRGSSTSKCQAGSSGWAFSWLASAPRWCCSPRKKPRSNPSPRRVCPRLMSRLFRPRHR